jgi:hypothetical protein
LAPFILHETLSDGLNAVYEFDFLREV